MTNCLAAAIRSFARKEIFIGVALFFAGAAAAEDQDTALQSVLTDGTIGFLLTTLGLTVYETATGEEECPSGFNTGARAQIAAQMQKLAQESGGARPTLEETQLWYNTGRAWPELIEEPLPHQVVRGEISYGLNLDAQATPEDFRSPDGEPGIDNELYRVIGCTQRFTEPEATFRAAFIRLPYSRTLIEISDVDDLSNDENVTVTTYRGVDRIVLDGTDKPLAGTSQWIDSKRGDRFVHTFRGKIVDGVLITEPGEWVYPWIMNNDGMQMPLEQRIRAARFRLNLTPKSAEGLIGGYADINTFYQIVIKSGPTSQSGPAFYQALARHADGFPDEETGANTAISVALHAELVQAFIRHPAAADPLSPERFFESHIADETPNLQQSSGASNSGAAQSGGQL